MFEFNTPGLVPFCHSRPDFIGRNLNMDSGYSAKAEFRNDTSGDTPLLAAGLFIYVFTIKFSGIIKSILEFNGPKNKKKSFT